MSMSELLSPLLGCTSSRRDSSEWLPHWNAPQWGHIPKTGAADFDYCFVFPLPNYDQALSHEAEYSLRSDQQRKELKRLAAEAKKLLEEEDRRWREQLQERTRIKASVQEINATTDVRLQAKDLFYDVFFDADLAEATAVDNVDSLEAARAATIELLLSFFRAESDRYYTYLFTSIDQDELILCVKMLEDAAVRHACDSSYLMPLDMKAIVDPKKLNIKLEPGPGGPRGAAMSPAHVPLEACILHMFQQHPSEVNPDVFSHLRKVDSIRLLHDRVTDIMDLDLLIKWQLVKEAFPLHCMKRLEVLKKRWASLGLLFTYSQPLEIVRDYFGETVTLYFIFAGHLYQYLLLLAAFHGCTLYVNCRYGYEPADILGTLGGIYAPPLVRVASILITVLWAHIFAIHLRRKHAESNAKWHTSYTTESDVKSAPNPRYAAMAHMAPSDVDANLVEFMVPYWKRRLGRVISVLGTGAFIAFTLACCALLLRAKAYCLSIGERTLSLLASYAVTLQIKVCSYAWDWLGNVLTDYEYHRDQLAYDSSVAFKSYSVQLINLYASFVYLAFLMAPWHDRSYSVYGKTPWVYLTYQMATTFCLYLALSLKDAVGPVLALWWRTRAELRKLKLCGHLASNSRGSPYSFLELQTKMESYTGVERNADYLDLLSILGFAAGFGVAFPLGSILALVYTMLQLRVDAIKLTSVLRRPWPLLCLDTWQWLTISSHLLVLCVMSNMGFLVAYTEPFASMAMDRQLLVFALLLAVNIALHAALTVLVPPISQDVELAGRRRRRQINQLSKYKAHKAKRSFESAKVDLICSGDAGFLNVPRLLKRPGKQALPFEEPTQHHFSAFGGLFFVRIPWWHDTLKSWGWI